MSMMFTTADSAVRGAEARKPGFFDLLGAAIRIAGAVDSHRPADQRDIELLGLPADLNERLVGHYASRG